MPKNSDIGYRSDLQLMSLNTGRWFTALTASLTLAASPCVFAAGNTQQTAAKSQAQSAQASNTASSWQTYLRHLSHYVNQQPEVTAQRARVNAGKADVSAQKGNIGLKAGINYENYPNGVGTSTGGSFTNLRQRGEARLSWGLLDFFARRPGRIEQAKGSENQHRYDASTAEIQTEQTLISDEVAAWAASPARKALKRGLQQAMNAKTKLGLAARASMANITHATPQRVTEALTVYSQIRSRLAALPETEPNAPRVPTNFSVLPLHAPRITAIKKIAQNSPQVKSYEAQSNAAAGEAQSYWGNGVHLNVFGGYITEKRQGTNKFKNGPEYGASLTIPIGTMDHDKANAAKWRAKANSLDAKAAIIKQQRQLFQLRQQWSSDAASMEAAEADMQRQATMLNKMKIRAKYPKSGQAPEPWQLDMQAAKFWLSVGEVWDKRRQWVQDTLTWALYDPSYLQTYARPSNPSAVHSLCAPLTSCEKEHS